MYIRILLHSYGERVIFPPFVRKEHEMHFFEQKQAFFTWQEDRRKKGIFKKGKQTSGFFRPSFLLSFIYITSVSERLAMYGPYIDEVNDFGES